MTTAILTARFQAPLYLTDIQEIFPDGVSGVKITHLYHDPRSGQGLQAPYRRMMLAKSVYTCRPISAFFHLCLLPYIKQSEQESFAFKKTTFLSTH